MAEDMEMFLEEIIKKTNPQEYIKILEQDRQDFAEEIERLNNIINELEKWLEEKQILYGINQQGFSWGVCGEALDKLNELKGDNK